MSMPLDLFYPLSTVTCVMVFKAKQPHPSNYETWFGYWRDDGFIKAKKFGRIDGKYKWKNIRDKWVNSFKNKRVINGESLKKIVKWNDEWCAEAYMRTDYSQINQDSVFQAIDNYIVYNLTNERHEEDEETE